MSKHTSSKIKFSFNPHILPIFRGMMSTIYCDLKPNKTHKDIVRYLKNYYSDFEFIKFIESNNRIGGIGK